MRRGMRPRKRCGTTTGVAAALALLAAVASAHAPRTGSSHKGGSQLYDEIDVGLVELDVAVEDRRGRPVDDLEQDAFEVLIDGEIAAIRGFAAPAGGADDRATANGDRPADRNDPPTRVVFLIDPRNVDIRRAERTRGRLREILAAPPDGTRYMLVEAEATRYRTLGSFTDLPAALADALDEIAFAGLSESGRQLREITRSIQRLLSNEIAVTTSSRESHVQLVAAQINAYSTAVRRQSQQAMTSLGRLVDTVRGLPGRGAVVYIGAGIPLAPGNSLLNALRSAYQLIPVDDSAVKRPSLVGVGADYGSGAELERLALHASVADVRIGALDIGATPQSLTLDMSGRPALAEGASRPGEELLDPELRFAERIDLGNVMAVLADATGGRVFRRNDGVERALDLLAGSRRGVYRLTVEPVLDGSRTPGSVHAIAVLVDRRALGVSHRRHFRYPTVDERAERLLRAALVSTAEINPLDISVEIVATGSGEGSAVVAVDIPLDNLAVRPDGDVHKGQLSIYLAAGDGGAVDGEISKLVLPLRIRNDELVGAMGRHVTHRAELELPPGTDRLAVAVRDDLGTATSVVTVPAARP